MKILNVTLLLLALGFLFMGCNPFKEPELVEVRNLSLEKMGLSTSTLKMDLVYRNPNNLRFQLMASSFDLYMEKVFLGHASSDSVIKVDKKSVFVLPITLEADMKYLFKNAWNMMLQETVWVQAKGTITLKAAGIQKSLPLNYEGRHAIKLF